MSKRGVDLGGEFRYLERDYGGQVARQLPAQRPAARHATAGAMRCSTTASIGTGLPIGGARPEPQPQPRERRQLLARFLRAARPRSPSACWPTTARCPGRAAISRSSRRALKWQTLQDVECADRAAVRPAAAAGRRATPAATCRAAWKRMWKPTTPASRRTALLTGQPNAQRSYTLAQISRPWQAPGWFVTPKLQLHATSYQFDAPLANGAQLGQPGRSHLQPGQRPGVRARRQLLRPQLPPDAGAAGLLRATRRSATRACCPTTTRPRTTSTSRPSTPRTRSAATTAFPTTTC